MRAMDCGNGAARGKWISSSLERSAALPHGRHHDGVSASRYSKGTHRNTKKPGKERNATPQKGKGRPQRRKGRGTPQRRKDRRTTQIDSWNATDGPKRHNAERERHKNKTEHNICTSMLPCRLQPAPWRDEESAAKCLQVLSSLGRFLAFPGARGVAQKCGLSCDTRGLQIAARVRGPDMNLFGPEMNQLGSARRKVLWPARTPG